MKSIKIIIVLILLSVLASAQDTLPVIKSNSQKASIQDGNQMKRNGWTLSPQVKPDIYEADLSYGKPHKVTFITDVDQISFNVEEGKKYDFIIQRGADLCYTQIVGTRFIPPAEFDKKYQAAHRNKLFVSVPEVYELVNVAIALTPTGINDKWLVYKNSDYYKRMRQWFDKYQSHPLLTALDAEIKKGTSAYFNLKMNGNSFEYDKNNKIVQSKIYDRITYPGQKVNALRPSLKQLQAFSEATNFREFYKQNRKIYNEQMSYYRDTANIAVMKRWLDKNFPTSNDFNTYNIIFSPLVYASQSSVWFESNGFKELQPHVNFPYLEDVERLAQFKMSNQAANVARGNIVFTEINHGYIGTEAGKYAERILKATDNRDFWVDKTKGRGYYPGIAAFNEYMNWALVSLRYVDYVPKNEQEKLITGVDRLMTKNRGFLQFEQFDKFLVDLYRNRKANQTVADLYPQIIEWFEKQNKEN